MPALFDHSAVPQAGRRYRRGTIVASFVVHVAVLAVIVVVQLSAALDGLDVNRRLELFVLPATPPPPQVEVAPPPQATAAINPEAAPVEANDVVLDEPPPPPVTVRGPVTPGAIVIGDPGRGPGIGKPVGQSVVLSEARKPPEPVRPGGDVKAPERTSYTAPVYSEIARAARVEGTVILEATIDETGTVRNVVVLRSIPLLDRAAIDAVLKWRYTPTRLNGLPVAVLMTVTVTFRLR
jgi:protein TonB